MNYDYDQQILAVLQDDGGFLTGDVAAKVTPMFGHNQHTHSGFIRQRLLALQAQGLVKPMDDLRPVVWLKVSDQ